MVAWRVGAPLLGCLVAAAVVLPPAASAAFPGSDGKIVVDTNDAFGCTGSCIDSGGPTGSIFAVEPSSGRASVLSPPTDVFDAAPRWSPRGTALTFVSGPSRGYFPGEKYPPSVSAVVTDATGGSRRSLPLPRGVSSFVDPTWTEDGSHLLAVGVRAGTSQRDLYRVATHGSGSTRVQIKGALGARHRIESPIMSSRRQIAFVQDDRIYLLERGGKARRLHSGLEPDFSPSGRQIVFFNPDRGEIDSIGVNGRGLRRLRGLHRDGGDPSPHPVYSPSGRYVAFTVAGASTNRLERMRADGSHLRDLRVSVIYPQDPDWQPLLSAASH